MNEDTKAIVASNLTVAVYSRQKDTYSGRGAISNPVIGVLKTYQEIYAHLDEPEGLQRTDKTAVTEGTKKPAKKRVS